MERLQLISDLFRVASEEGQGDNMVVLSPTGAMGLSVIIDEAMDKFAAADNSDRGNQEASRDC